MKERLLMYPVTEYPGVGKDDPIRFYSRPIFGALYRRRVEMCLADLQGGSDMLEVGFGSGVTFRNLSSKYKQISGLDLDADVELISAFWREKGIEVDLKSGSVLGMPYPDRSFDAVLLISILEHLRPNQLQTAFSEILRVLRPGGQAVYGVPMDWWGMRLAFRVLGYDIRLHHFSSELDVRTAAQQILTPVRIRTLTAPVLPIGLYQVGDFRKVGRTGMGSAQGGG